MILEFGFGVIAAVVGWLFTFVPPADGLEGLAGQMSTVFDPLAAGLSGLGGWMPWGVLSTCVTITLAFWTATLILRVIKSFLPTVSG